MKHLSRICSIIRPITFIAIALSILIMPVQAQQQATSAILLDGRELFEVSQAGSFSAEIRAADANLILKSAVNSREPVQGNSFNGSANSSSKDRN